MTKSNTIILLHNIINEDRINMTTILRQLRKLFQRLFQCATLVASFEFRYKERPILLRDITSIASRQGFEKINTFEDREI